MPAQPRRPPTVFRPSRLAVAHGISAILILLFAAAHLVNHLGGLAGGETHRGIMRALRALYRDRLVEPLLLAAVAFQVASGLWLLRGALARAATRLDTLQTATGAYMLLFFASHVSAVLRARLLRGRDTDWAWLAGGELLTDPWSARLGPYYFLAVVALGLHAACGLRRVLLAHNISPASGRNLVAVIGTAATAIAAAILVGLLRA
jgi:succinate dehydrogenase/fumarate reductase cytochrome b subunit